MWHLSTYYELMMRDHNVHIVTHLMFMVTATLMWWPVMSPVPELLPRLSYGLGMLYLFLVGIPMQIVAALISLSGTVLYPWYSVAARTWGLSPLDDQQLGGLLMWVPGNLYMFLVIGVLFLVWSRENQ
jgi:putative membrane protein